MSERAVELERTGDAARSRTMTGRTRRQFLIAAGTGVAATAVAPNVGAQKTVTVAMGNNYFDPVGLAVDPGTTVRFEIEDGSHSATAYDDRIPASATPFDSGTISDGGFEHTFEATGTYDYHCIPHRSMGMTGRIVVGGPGGPAEETPIPEGSAPASEEIVAQGRIDAGGGSRGRHAGRGGCRDDGPMGGGRGPMSGDHRDWWMLFPAGLVTFLGLAAGAVSRMVGR